VLAALIRDTTFIRKRPGVFLLEFLVLCIAPSFVICWFIYSRNEEPSGAVEASIATAVGLSLGHLGLQLCGYYYHVFPKLAD
jgi:hypothetical protein